MVLGPSIHWLDKDQLKPLLGFKKQSLHEFLPGYEMGSILQYAIVAHFGGVEGANVRFQAWNTQPHELGDHTRSSQLFLLHQDQLSARQGVQCVLLATGASMQETNMQLEKVH